MRKTNFGDVGMIALGIAIFAAFLLPACSVNVKKGTTGEDKNVDIKTLLGGIHVSKGADVADTGLSVYPGARLKPQESGHDDKSANVSISGFGFALRVVALQYESDDSPEKVIAFYRDQLRKYGSVLECHSQGHFNMNMKYSDKSSHAVTCDTDNGKNVELKVGTDENQHIVAVESEGKGSSFSLVYVRTHGKEANI